MMRIRKDAKKIEEINRQHVFNCLKTWYLGNRKVWDKQRESGEIIVSQNFG